jgi:hypothetical protein
MQPVTGRMVAAFRSALERWDMGSKSLMRSRVSPKNSRRKGWSYPGQKMSMMSPRRDVSPTAVTMDTRE